MSMNEYEVATVSLGEEDSGYEFVNVKADWFVYSGTDKDGVAHYEFYKQDDAGEELVAMIKADIVLWVVKDEPNEYIVEVKSDGAAMNEEANDGGHE